jgi:two-component sensor histidine kinase
MQVAMMSITACCPKSHNTALLWLPLLQASEFDDVMAVAAQTIKNNIQDIRETVRELAAGGRSRGSDGRNYIRMLSQEASETKLHPSVQLVDRIAADHHAADEL